MARFTIQLPAELAGDGTTSERTEAGDRSEAGERTAANAAGYRTDHPEARADGGEGDAATRGFVAWVECWAGA
ncbi:hypothetical protein [Halosimplex marinum]|uniref:hypothetical protein n=1 Tax=Halosimplex marinum TaxID=3396620 RepID=UPI003F54AA25